MTGNVFFLEFEILVEGAAGRASMTNGKFLGKTYSDSDSDEED
jgi:hypothetical protein